MRPTKDFGDPRALNRPSATAGLKRGRGNGRGLGVWWAGSEPRVQILGGWVSGWGLWWAELEVRERTWVSRLVGGT